jgi:hypothetical protein
MNLSWEEEYFKAMASFPQIVEEPKEYRIHYDDTGWITMCSMQQHPDSTQYLVVDLDAYGNYWRYRVNVKKKKLEKIEIDLGISVKLKKSDHGYPVVKNHAGLIIEQDESYDDIEYYNTNDN